MSQTVRNIEADTQAKTIELASTMFDVMSMVRSLKSEVRRLKEENAELRRQLVGRE